MNKFLVIGAVIAALGVIIGAFGAHALKDTLVKAGNSETYETAVKYQFYHAFAILLVGVLVQRQQTQWLSWAGWAFLIGILIFSGALYLICFTGKKYFGAIAPIGGTAFIAGWILFAIGVSKLNV
jgi:uncharacterized membrane protein YgdD (TMEM256/DUF423 family)